MSTIFFDRVVVTSVNATTDRTMLGGVVGGSPAQDSIPQLTATAYLNGVALNPQPSFAWYSSNPNVATVDQSGNVTRTAANPNALSYDSNGTVSTGQLGGLSRIRAVALLPNGAESGVEGYLDIVVQAPGFGPLGINTGGFGNPIQPAKSSTDATGFYNLVDPQ